MLSFTETLEYHKSHFEFYIVAILAKRLAQRSNSTMGRPLIIVLGLFTICMCLAITEGRARRNIFKRDDDLPEVQVVPLAKREDDSSGAVFVRDDRSDSESSSDEDDQKDVKRNDEAPAADVVGIVAEREARSSSSSEENDDGGVDRDTRAAVKSKKSKKSKSKATTPAPENLCPLGTKYKSECNRCFCNPINGVSGCTMMACFKLVIPTTSAPPAPDAPAAPDAAVPEDSS